MSTRQAALSLYRRSLKLALDWTVERQLWRGQAIYIRSLFEANRTIADPRLQRTLLTETEQLLESWKHPDPYISPTAPGGSKYERNMGVPNIAEPPSPPPKV
jgi:NADH dehydrogenase (ubiquinone) 1 beta subcomplex subunit 9